MTLEELSKFDGKEERKAYIAYNGKIYDITDSDFWPNGKHMGMFTAGKDLTESLAQSPHGEKNILKYPCVGDLTADASAPVGASSNGSASPKKTINKQARYQELYVKYHPHPMIVHFPMALFPFALLLQIVNICIGGELFVYSAALMAFVFATIMSVPVIATGALSLWINYSWKPNKYLKRKIILSMLLLIFGIAGSVIGLNDLYLVACPASPEYVGAITKFGVSVSYSVINFIMLILISGLGFYGGKLTWGNR